MEYLTDKDGKWKLRKGKKYQLIEPSQEYIDANTPTQEQLDIESSKEILQQVTVTDTKLVRFIEDLVVAISENEQKFADLGITLPSEILTIVQERKGHRSKLKK